MARRSNLPNLVRDAFEHGEVQTSGRNWIATRMDEADRSPFRVSVQHRGTHMFNVTLAGVVEPVDRGHGSQSDMCGVRAITKGYGCGGPQGLGYREVYDDEPMNRLSGDQWRGAIQHPDVGNLRLAIPPYPHAPFAVGSSAPGRSRRDPEDTFNYADMNPPDQADIHGRRFRPNYSQPDPFGPAEGTSAELNEYLAGVEARQAARRSERE